MSTEISTPTIGIIKPSQETIEESVERLSGLSDLDYQQVRVDEAKVLSIRVSVLDGYVYNQRKNEQPDYSIFENIEPWHDPVCTNWLIDEIKKQIKQFCALPENYLAPIVLWIIGTYCFNAFRVYPKLCIYSPQKRCGKSTLMEVIDALAFNSLMASNVSPAVIYRVIEKYQPTLLLDEADAWLVGRNADEAMRGIINSGHTKTTAKILRCDGDKNEPKSFSTWSPMVIGMIGKPQATIVDRSIMVPMRRKLKNESLIKLSVDYKETCMILRRCILRWSDDNLEALRNTNIIPPLLNNDRAMDNWTATFNLAHLIGEPLLTEINHSYLAINNEELDEEDIGIVLLKDIKNIFEQESIETMHSFFIINKLVMMEDRPWREWRRGAAMTANSLANILKPFNIRPKDIRHGGSVRKGYDKKEFLDAFNRYI